MSHETKLQTKGNLNKKLLISAVAVISITLVAALVFFLPKSAEAKKLTEQLNLGDKYLSELNYEQAMVSYLAAIEIDSKNVDAYLGLADAYIAQGEYDEAIKVLEDALAKLGEDAVDAEAVKDKLAEVEAAKNAVEVAPTAEPTEVPVESTPILVPTATSTPTPSPEPTVTSTPTPSSESTATPVPTVVLAPEELFKYTIEDGEVTITGMTTKELEHVVVPENIEGCKVTAIGDHAFASYKRLISIELPEGINSIEPYAFSSCSALEKVVMPESVTSISEFAFAWCISLKNIELYEGITGIETSTFYMCKSLTGIEIPNGVTSIGQRAFYGCESLTSIRLPEGINSIGTIAFANCSSLTEFRLPDSVEEMGNNVFDGCSGIETLYISKKLKKIGNYSAETPQNGVVQGIGICTSLKAFVVPEENELFTAVNGVLYSKAMDTLFYVPGSFSGEFIIPNTVTRLSGNVFCSCSKITKIIFEEPMTSMSCGGFSFTGLSSLEWIEVVEWWVSVPGTWSPGGILESVPAKLCGTEYVIPDVITRIGRYAFDNCLDLEKIHIGAGVVPTKAYGREQYGTEEHNYFYKSPSIKEISVDTGNTAYVAKNNVLFTKDETVLVSMPCDYESTTYYIPEGTVYLAEYAFANCKKLASVTLPKSLKAISMFTFNGCTSLKEVVIPEGVTIIGRSAFGNCTSLETLVVPESVTVIEASAINKKTTIITPAGSYAETYAIENGIPVQNP